jgi:hypothetical protein
VQYSNNAESERLGIDGLASSILKTVRTCSDNCIGWPLQNDVAVWPSNLYLHEPQINTNTVLQQSGLFGGLIEVGVWLCEVG